MISTKNLPTTENTDNFIKSVFSPGNHKLKINKIYLKEESKSEFGTKLLMLLETPEITAPGFKGLSINPQDPNSGTYKGQIGTVKYSKWGYKDFLTNSGIQILREEEILKAVRNICDNLGISDWFKEADNRFPTIEAFVEGFNSEAPFKGIWAYYCIAGKEFLSKDLKHVNHDLYLPNYERVLGAPFSLKEEKVQKFLYSNHVIPISTQTPKTEKPADKPVETTSTNSADDDMPAFLRELNMPVGTPEEQKAFKETIKNDGPVRPAVTSQLEQDFMDAGKKTIETPFTDAINNEFQEESKTDIITGSPEEKMPWD